MKSHAPDPAASLARRPRVGITMGDPAGVGPEVVLKAIAEEEVRAVCRPVIIGDAQLLAHNARMDIFAATMLGKVDIVKAAVTAFPNIVHVPGPHKIPLIAHAEKGGPPAAAVLEFLRPLVS